MTDPDLERTPLLDAAGREMLSRLREHPEAPRWNYAVGDRLLAGDLPELDRFRERIATGRDARGSGPPPPAILARLAHARGHVPWFETHLPPALDLERDWERVPTSRRADLAAAPWAFVPDDADLERLVIYRTAGTTGHPIQVPHHPRAVACYQPLIEHALRAHGVRDFAPRADEVASFLVGAQVKTYTYATVLTSWGGTGFAKVNLRATEWPREGSSARYIREFGPPLIAGEPVAFAELLRLGTLARPKALLSTSVALSPGLAARLRDAFGCPVVDWYSLVETGPVACACPLGMGMHILPPDVHVEVLRPDGTQARPDERGEVAVSGGRNPFLPLLRYRTGDHARLEPAPCACGDRAPRLVDLEGRAPVLFRAACGTPVGTVDVSRLLREFPLARHSLRQRADGSCELVACPLPDAPPPDPGAIEAAMRGLLGDLPITVRIERSMGDGGERKVVPYESELEI